MLITTSTRSQTPEEMLLDSKPSTEQPFFISICLVRSGTKPICIKPALKASIASGASRRAMASAIGLRQAFPMQTNKTFLHPALLLIRTFAQQPMQQPYSQPCLAEASTPTAHPREGEVQRSDRRVESSPPA